MEHTDVVVIGGGVLGCFVARNLRRWNIDVTLIEAEADVCMGITRANTAIVYSGCDNKSGSLKARMTVNANKQFSSLCEELDVPFKRCGSLMVAQGPQAEAVLKMKLEQGKRNGVVGIALLSGSEARSMEPLLSSGITAALFVPGTGTVNPWQLGIAAFENARTNGRQTMLNTLVRKIEKDQDHFLIETEHHSIRCHVIVNCAGLNADHIQEMVFPPTVRLTFDAADYLIFDRKVSSPRQIIFQEREDGKGATLVPTVEGNMLIESPERTLNTAMWATTKDGLEKLQMLIAELLPNMSMTGVIRSFAAVRPNPFLISNEKKRLNDFVIVRPAENFFSFIGIKTPGLTCANGLSMYVAEEVASFLKSSLNRSFLPKRCMDQEKDNEIICQCGQITKGEVISAIKRGACTVDGVKHRVGSGMGRCQGARCRKRIQQLLEEQKNGTL